MKKIMFLMFFWVSSILAGESYITYQGKLVQGTNLVNDTVAMRLRIYTNEVGGAFVYEETNMVVVIDGLYSFLIGKNPNYGQLKKIVAYSDKYLEITVNGETLSPRELFTAAPYASSVDEKSLIASTEFLYRMVVKHELEIAKLKSYNGLTVSTIPENYLIDEFENCTDRKRNGDLMGIIDVTNSTALYNVYDRNWAACGAITSLVATLTVTGIQDKVWIAAFSNINRTVSAVSFEISTDGRYSTPPSEPQAYIEYVCNDGTTNTGAAWGYSGCYNYRVVSNTYPSKVVSHINVYADSRVYGEGLNTTYVRNISAHSYATGQVGKIVLNLSSLANKPAHVALSVVLLNRVPNDGCDFDITDGTVTLTNLALDTKHSLEAMTNALKTVTINLRSGTSGNGLTTTAMESYFLKWWKE